MTAIGLVGLGTSIFSGLMGSSAASQASDIQKQMAQTEMQVNGQKRQQMVLQSRRQQLENIRNVQRARAQGLNTATNQGAQFGSGLAGGQAQASDQGNVNALGFSQNLEIGQNIFNLDDKLDQQKMQLADVQSSANTYAAVGSVGSSISKSSSIFGNLFQGMGGSSGGGNFAGMPWSQNTGNLY